MARECGATPANPRIIFWYPPAQDFSPPSDPPHINGRKLFFTLSPCILSLRSLFHDHVSDSAFPITRKQKIISRRKGLLGRNTVAQVCIHIYTYIQSMQWSRPKCYSMRQRLLLQVTRSSRPRRWTTTSCESPMASTKFFTLFSVNVHCQIPWG